MDNKTLKKQLERYYVKCLNIDYSFNKHPLMLIEAVKSISGINLDAKSDTLINFLDSYMAKCVNHEKNNSYELKNPNLELPEVVSLNDLESYIVAQNLSKSIDLVHLLTKVSEGTQILEFLLELSLKYSNYNTSLFIWSTYKMEKFFNNKYLLTSICICIEKIINTFSNENIHNKSKVVDWPVLFKNPKYSFNKLSLYYSVYNEEALIRKNKIKNNISLLDLTTYKEDFKYNRLFNNNKKEGRQWILDFADNNTLNYDIVLYLNAIRAYFKVDQSNQNKFWKRF